MMFGIIRKARNFIGSQLGFGSCPNCGDSWHWKISGSLPYNDLKIVNKVISDERIATGMVSAQKSILLCQECLNNPEKLDLENIRRDLDDTEDWEKEEIGLVIESIKKYKSAEKAKTEQ